MTAKRRRPAGGPGADVRANEQDGGKIVGFRPDGKSSGLDFEAPSEDDRLWFERHPARNYRLRPPIGGQRVLLGPAPRGCRKLVAVRQIRPGARVWLPVTWCGPRPLGSEALARELFERAVADDEKVRGLIREMAP